MLQACHPTAGFEAGVLAGDDPEVLQRWELHRACAAHQDDVVDVASIALSRIGFDARLQEVQHVLAMLIVFLKVGVDDQYPLFGLPGPARASCR
eukprot:9522342-Prorocentrum_lima.AAC.1